MDRTCMEEKYRQYSNTVFRTAYACVKHLAEAEDITSEVFMKYFTCNQRFDSQEHEKAWLIRVTVNRCRDLFRSSRFKKYADMEEYEPFCEMDEEHEVMEAVMSLPKKYRTAVHLYYYEGYSTEEIAKITNSTATAVRKQLSRAREMLKNKLGEEQEL